MPIRFFCEKCHKPLEVNSELAGQQALCFHCKSRTNVPIRSVPELLGDNVVSPEESSSEEGASECPFVAGQRSCPFSTSGVIGLMLSFAVILVLMSLVSTIISEIAPVVKSPEFKQLSQEQQAQRMHKEIMRITHSSKTVMLAFSSVLLWILAFIFSLIGFIRQRGRIAGLIGLVLCTAIVLAIIRQMH